MRAAHQSLLSGGDRRRGHRRCDRIPFSGFRFTTQAAETEVEDTSTSERTKHGSVRGSAGHIFWFLRVYIVVWVVLAPQFCACMVGFQEGPYLVVCTIGFKEC